ncbi:MAG: Ldh family oxidoreductase [Burkholderiales bacterium]|nr:Ldh family oxidoreductase [Burkholderiales bacterium]
MASIRVNHERLLDFCAAVYAGAGVRDADARLVADTLVQADPWGHQSHGVLRLGWYLDRIRNRVLDPVTKPEFVVDAGAMALVDGHDGVGHVLTVLAAKEAVGRAKRHGIGAVGVRSSNHFGTCMNYTTMAEHKGYAIVAMVDVLSGVLTGSGFLSAVHSPYKTAEKSNCGHLMIAIDIGAFQPLAEFNARMERFADEIKAVPPARGFEEVFYPGEIEARNDPRNRRDGIELPEDTRADLARIARESGLESKSPLA